jgi:serine/threonine protein kinase
LVTIIQHLHGIGIHHHDLKCSNIVRRPDGTLVVIDFGFATLGEVCETRDCEDWIWLASGQSFRWYMEQPIFDPTLNAVHPSAKVPEWFPPPPISPAFRRRLSAKSLYICSAIIVGVSFCSVFLGQSLVPSVGLQGHHSLNSGLTEYVKSIVIG